MVDAELHLLREGRPRRGRALAGRELVVEGSAALLFVAGAAALLLAYPPGELAVGTVLALVGAHAVLSRVEYQAGVLYTVPTQLVFVPMLFLATPALAPALVAAGYLLGRLPDYATRRLDPRRVTVDLADCWYSLGPAFVLAVSGAGEPSWADWPLYAAALATQLILAFGVTALRERAIRGLGLRAQAPALAGICAFDGVLSPVGLLAAFASTSQELAFLLVLPFALVFASLTRERDAHIGEALELSRAYKGTARLLGEVLEEASGYTGAHSRNVVGLALGVADELELEATARQEVEFTALLHDVGKLAMPRAIIEKPGPLSDEEWALIKTHTLEGERLLRQVGGVLGRVGSAVRSSHERWDGRGYPDGLAGEEIPLAARIVACCDALDAMSSDRPYRSALPHEAAIAELRASAGTQFDPQVTELAAKLGEERIDSLGTRRDAEEIAAVAEATRELTQATDRDAAHKAISRAALRLSGAQAAVLLEPDAEGNPRDAPAAAHELLSSIGATCAHFEPVVRNGALLAVLAAASRDWRDEAPATARRRLRLLAAEAAIALERTDLVARLRAAVRTDELTGLLKRGAWEEELRREFTRSARDGRKLCVVMLDLDHFKEYNDAHGHPAGDEALRQCATAWRAELRLTDHLARYGGDEFIGLLPSCSPSSAHQLVERLTLSTPFGLSCSAGIAAWDGSENPSELVNRADGALLAAKQSGRRRISSAA